MMELHIKGKMMDYYIFGASPKEEYAWLQFKSPQFITDEIWRVKFGQSIVDIYPSVPPVWKVDSEKGDVIADYLNNYDNIKVVSTQFKEFLSNLSPDDFEFYPIQIQNKDEEILYETYWITHLRKTVSCLNKERSDFETNELSNKWQVDYFRRLILDVDRIPSDSKLFRLEEKQDMWIIREDLVKNIFLENDFYGIGAQALKNHGSQFRNPYTYVPDEEAGY